MRSCITIVTGNTKYNWIEVKENEGDILLEENPPSDQKKTLILSLSNLT